VARKERKKIILMGAPMFVGHDNLMSTWLFVRDERFRENDT